MRARSSLFFSHHAKAVRELTARRTPPRTTSHLCIDDFKRLQVFYTWSYRTDMSQISNSARAGIRVEQSHLVELGHSPSRL